MFPLNTSAPNIPLETSVSKGWGMRGAGIFPKVFLPFWYATKKLRCSHHAK